MGVRLFIIAVNTFIYFKIENKYRHVLDYTNIQRLGLGVVIDGRLR